MYISKVGINPFLSGKVLAADDAIALVVEPRLKNKLCGCCRGISVPIFMSLQSRIEATQLSAILLMDIQEMKGFNLSEEVMPTWLAIQCSKGIYLSTRKF